MQITNKYAIENDIAIEEIFQVAISQYTKNADKLAIEEEISNFLFFDTFFTNRFTGNFSNVVSLSFGLVRHEQFRTVQIFGLETDLKRLETRSNPGSNLRTRTGVFAKLWLV